jgi:hypothetical protein
MFERCVGLPSGPCPAGRCDSTVTFGYGELFLCPECEAARLAQNDLGVTVLPKKQFTKSSTRAATRATRAAQNKPAQKTMSQPTRTRKTASTTENRKKAARQIEQTEVISDNSDEDLEDTCPHCLLALKGQLVKCDVCQMKIHTSCTSVPPEAQSILVKYAIDIGWVCDDCKEAMNTSYHRLQSSISVLTEELSAIRTQLNVMQLSSLSATKTDERNYRDAVLDNIPSQPGIIRTNGTENCTDDAHISLVVHRTLNDAARRRQNVVITGLPENPNIDDVTAFTELCECCLPVKPTVATGGCRRIGKETNDGPRRLLIRLNSENMAAELIRSAPLLRKSGDHYICLASSVG